MGEVMREGSERWTSGDRACKNETDFETRLSWTGGSVLFKAVRPSGSFHREFLRNDLAIGVVSSLNFESRFTWWLDGRLVLDKKESAMSAAGDLIIVPPGCEFQGTGYGGMQGFWLLIDPQIVKGDERLKCLAESATVDCIWSKDRPLRSAVSEIRKECLNDFPRGPMFLEESAMGLLTHAACALDGSQSDLISTPKLSNRNLRTLIDYIESNLNRSITLQELSTLVGLTPKYFCSAFKHTTGRPPHQFQIERRVERARVLLRDPTLRLKDVASIVGFRNQNRLNDYFLRIVGVSVARYRKDVREK
jgi:AraC family transcriptional regulator